jgi:O-methyltransferase involved in polyketide biosynthesis
MSASKIQLVNTRATYLTTLYGKALDAGAASPILGDSFAAQAVERIDYDFSRLRMPSGGEITLPLRAKHLDGWTREFLTAHPSSSVLHLGCGLDSRVFRIDPVPSVRWFDVDVPEVIALRRQLYPERASYELIAASVTDAGLLQRVPRDQPVLVVAEGLMMYLPEADGIALLQQITSSFPEGQIVFDAYGSLTTRIITLASRLSPTPVSLPWGIDDPHSLERKVPALRLLDAVPFLTTPELLARMGRTRAQRAGYRLIKAVPRLRNSMLHLRYAFDRRG